MATLAAPAAPRAGLTSADAAARLTRDGPNVVPARRPPPPWRRLAGQLVHFFALMLWAAAGLALIAGMPQLSVAIAVVVVVNGGFAFAQEYRADRAAEQLQQLMPIRAVVRRDGVRRVVDAAELVVGDLVLLSPGDRISADLALTACHELAVDTSMLTGESVPVRPDVGGAAYAGTFVVEGEGEGEVMATGAGTRLADLARLAREAHRPPSPLALELHRVVRAVAVLAIGVGTAFFALSLALGMEAGEGFVFAIGVTVALVPEGLLPTVTLALAMGAQRMAARNAIVRRLESVETLGSVTYICTDKTGTLTRNEMTVVEAWTPEGALSARATGYDPTTAITLPGGAADALPELARAAARSSHGRVEHHDGGWRPHGDPMEAALDVFARRLGIDVPAEDRASTPTARYPFDPQRRRSSLVVGDRLLVKGAPDSVLPCCRPLPGAAEAVHRLTARGLRVLAIAVRDARDLPARASAAEVERDLTLLGVVGLEDPPRADVADALAACRRAGIRVAMVTGDHPMTAAAVAREVGLVSAQVPALVLEGAQLPADDRALGALLDQDGIVAARVAPEDKVRIARALQARGHVVAMTGDGVNDGPALQEAAIGVAMGAGGTDVAREAADLVLLDDRFATIVAAVEQGRATYANVRRFLTYHLTDNVAELTPFVVWALSAGHVPLAIGVLQVLCLDIGTDLLPALALGAERPSRDLLSRPPERRHLIDAALLRRVFGVLGPAEAALTMAAFATALFVIGWRPGDPAPTGHAAAVASGAAFMAIVVGQMGNAFALRSATRNAWSMRWRGNRLLVAAVGVELLALVGFLYVPVVADALDQAPPSWQAALVAVAAAPTVLAVDAVHKARRTRRRRVSRGDEAPAGSRPPR